MNKKPAVWLLLGVAFALFLLHSLGPIDLRVPNYSNTVLSGSDDQLKTAAPATKGQAGSTICRWDFSHYESSAYEEKWFSMVKTAQARVCETLKEKEHADASASILTRVQELTRLAKSVTWHNMTPESVQHIPGTAPADQFMSKMHYRRSCYDSPSQEWNQMPTGFGVQLIEPLWGLLRDPFDAYCALPTTSMPAYSNPFDGQSKEHIMPQGFAPYAFGDDASSSDALSNWVSHGIPPWLHGAQVIQGRYGEYVESGRNIHLDLGSSYFATWTQNAAAASGRWFYETYHGRGLEFDKFVAVEVEKLDPLTAYEQVPKDLIGAYSLVNAPLSMKAGDTLHAVDMIKNMVRPQDFFVFKLDIDSAPIEEPIAQMLLNDKSASDLVDELMFEHHVNLIPLNGPWFPHGVPPGTADLADSFNLFRDLRKKGVRSHSWP